MKSKIAILVLAVLVAMNAGLLLSNHNLVCALRDVKQQALSEAGQLLTRERGNLAAERTRLCQIVASLREAVNTLPGKSAMPLPPDPSMSATPLAGQGPEASSPKPATITDGETAKPNISLIALMTDEERAALKETRRALPRGIDESLLLQGDIDMLLRDTSWNPDGQPLNADNREILAGLMRDYEYFARQSYTERYETMITPAVEKLRAAQAFVEYSQKEPPPAVAGISITHAELQADGTSRLFYFPPEDYPEFYRHKRIAEERAAERVVMIFELLNGQR